MNNNGGGVKTDHISDPKGSPMDNTEKDPERLGPGRRADDRGRGFVSQNAAGTGT